VAPPPLHPTCADYIFASVWGHKVYTIYSILFIVFIILIIVTAFITIALTYFQLAVEDHRWGRAGGRGAMHAEPVQLLELSAWLRLQLTKRSLGSDCMLQTSTATLPHPPCHRWWWRSIMCGGSTALFIYGELRRVGAGVALVQSQLGLLQLLLVKLLQPLWPALAFCGRRPNPDPFPRHSSVLLLLLVRAVGHERAHAGLILLRVHAHGLLR